MKYREVKRRITEIITNPIGLKIRTRKEIDSKTPRKPAPRGRVALVRKQKKFRPKWGEE